MQEKIYCFGLLLHPIFRTIPLAAKDNQHTNKTIKEFVQDNQVVDEEAEPEDLNVGVWELDKTMNEETRFYMTQGACLIHKSLKAWSFKL